MLICKYIPNLIAKPFDVSLEYAQIIYDQTSSPNLKVLKKWVSAENRQKLAYIILVKLLAYQFASPVRWIQTQDLLFTTFNFERLIELGPSSTLTGMATRTLKTKYETLDGSVSQNRSILCHAKNIKEIYYQYEDEIEAPASDVPVDVPVAPTPVTTTVSTPLSGPVAKMEDVPNKAIDILLVIVAQKLEKRVRVDKIPLSKSIKDLVTAPVGNQHFRMRFSVIFSKSSRRLLKKVKNFLLKNSVQCWEAASVVPLVNTVWALFLVSLEAKCLVVSICRLSRVISARAGDY
jgi:fatty acid synthase subunit alpha, fungi type